MGVLPGLDTGNLEVGEDQNVPKESESDNLPPD